MTTQTHQFPAITYYHRHMLHQKIHRPLKQDQSKTQKQSQSQSHTQNYATKVMCINYAQNRNENKSNVQYIVRVYSQSSLASPSISTVDATTVIKPSVIKKLAELEHPRLELDARSILKENETKEYKMRPLNDILKNNAKNIENNDDEKDKKPKKTSKCALCCQKYKQKYEEFEETNPFCLKFQRIQYLGRKYITTSAYFRYFILLCILANCCFIAFEDPTAPPDSERNEIVNKSETVFAIIFTMEMVIKMFCNGLFGKHMKEMEIEREIKTNKKNENNEHEHSTSDNQINQTNTMEDDDDDNHNNELDDKQTVEMTKFGHNIKVTSISPKLSPRTKMAKQQRTPSTSSTGAGDGGLPLTTMAAMHNHSGSSNSQSTWVSTQKAPSIESDKQQNDLHPDYFVGYFRDGWNILDFVIVVTSWIEWLPIDGGSNLTAIRVLRVLRPLRTFTKIKSLKVLIATIIKSLRGLSDVLVLLLFLFVVFAIIGIQMFVGKLHQQCFSDDFRNMPSSIWENDETKWIQDENFCVLRTGQSGNNDTQFNGCPDELPWCLNIAPNPNGGVTNFDNMIWAMVNVFVTISLEGWASIQYKLEATGLSLAWIYFVLLTFIVGFFAANLCLAVIESVYRQEMDKKNERAKKNGDDKILQRAKAETEIAWREQRETKMVIQKLAPPPPVRTAVKSVTFEDEIGGLEAITPFTSQQVNDIAMDITPRDNTAHVADDLNILSMSNSFRMPYVDKDGLNKEARTKFILKPSPRAKSLAFSADASGVIDIPTTKLSKHTKSKSLGTKKSIMNNTKVPMSSHAVGLIQTSRSWNNLIETQESSEKLNDEPKQKSAGDTPIRSRQLSHHKQASFRLIQSKKPKFQNELGLGSKSYMHRYRTGNIPTKDTDSNDANNQNINLSKSFLSIKSDGQHTPIPAAGPQKRGKSVGLTPDERRRKFSQSKPHVTNMSFSMTPRTTQTLADRIDMIGKVDYKAKTTENFGTSIDRVKRYMDSSKFDELENDRHDFESRQNTDRTEMSVNNNSNLIDDITFGDMPLQFQKSSPDSLHEKDEMSEEMRRRSHRAKKKRKQNEILARRAILIASEEPLYMKWLEKCVDCDREWITKINALVVSKYFDMFIMFVIMVNTIVLALTWPEQDQNLKNTLEIINTCLTFVFIFEAILKLLGLGPMAYFDDKWNRFDFIIVMVSLIELMIDAASATDNEGSAISALRSLRLLRAFRLLGKFDSLRQLFMLVVDALHEVSLLTIVLGIFIFMFAALAMSLFGGKLIALGDGRSGRWRYDNFYWSWLTVFMVISGDSWNEVMYDTVKATDDKFTVIYYIVLLCFGTFVILNLFVAILLSKMGSDESDEEFMLDGLVKYSQKMFRHNAKMLEEKQRQISEEEQVDRLVMYIERRKYIAQHKDKRSNWKHHIKEEERTKLQGKSLGLFDKDNAFRIWCHKVIHWTWFEISIDTMILINCVFLALESPKEREQSEQMFFVADVFFTVVFALEFIIKVIALGAFKQPWRSERRWKRITDDDQLLYWTDRSYQAVYFMNGVNDSILDIPGLAIECIKSNDGYYIVHLWSQQVLRIVFETSETELAEGKKKIDHVFTLTCYKLQNQEEGVWEMWDQKVGSPPKDSALEDVLKSYDLTDHHHNAYFASNWNRLDAFVVFVAVLGVPFDNISFLRALRAFRPFRIMVRFKKIKVVLGALLRAIPGLFNTALFCILFWFVFSILGVNWFSGLYRHCRIEDESLYISANNITNTDMFSEQYVMYNYGKTECDDSPGLSWEISVFNFDNIFQAIHTLFCVATLSGWNFVMYEGIDSTSFNQPLKEDNRPIVGVYFMVIVVLCSFFSLNLIVSVVVDNFNTIKAEKDGSAFQTEEQTTWVNNQRLLERISLDPTFSAPKQWFKRISFKIVEHDFFDPFIMFCIILNAVCMGLQHYNESSEWTLALEIADKSFVLIFVLEAIFKIAGYGFSLYILSNWNKFDFIISIIGVVGLMTDSGLGLNVLRLFRVARLLRLLHKAKTLKMLFWTLVYSIPSLWNIGLLLFVIFFIYAVVGMHILTTSPEPTAVHDQVNADNFFNALALLYRVGTEDGWTDVYASYLDAFPDNEKYKIYIYFISFFVLGTLVLINLFIAVVLDSFEENHQSFTREDEFITIQTWRDIWSYFDPDAKRELPVSDFIDILRLTPISDAFYEKHHIKGPGFHPTNPFLTLYKNNIPQLLGSRTSTDVLNESTQTSQYLARRLTTIYDQSDRKQELRNIATKVSHSDMIKLLLRLRLRVQMREDIDAELNCCGKLVKLVYDICSSMGISSEPTDKLMRSETFKSNKTESTKHDTMAFGLSKKDLTELQNEAKDKMADFDKGSKQWYVSYDEALLAICSEVIGPRLPDGFGLFVISDQENQLRIAEWYAIKYDCWRTFRDVNLEITANKQYSDHVPSQHVSDVKQAHLRKRTKLSPGYKRQLKNIAERLSHDFDENEEENADDHANGMSKGKMEKLNTMRIHHSVEMEEESYDLSEAETPNAEDQEEKENGDNDKNTKNEKKTNEIENNQNDSKPKVKIKEKK